MTQTQKESLYAAIGQYISSIVENARLEARLSGSHNWGPGRLPYKTGNMANIAFELEQMDASHYRISIDTGIAPYTEDVDTDPRYYTQGFWDLFYQRVCRTIAAGIGPYLESLGYGVGISEGNMAMDAEDEGAENPWAARDEEESQ